MNTQELAQLLSATIHARLPVMVTGAPGVGKSAVLEQAAARAGADYIVLYPALRDPTDMAGLPVPVNGRVERLLDDELMRIFEAPRPLVVLLDELGQASPAMQAACAPLLLSRRIGRHRLPEHVTVCAATNRRTDRAGASSILSHIVSRMAAVVELVPSLDTFCAWALKHHVRPEVISFLRLRPKLLHDFTPEKAHEPYACPRSWANLSALLDARMSDAVEYMAFSGCVGVGPATEFLTHLHIARDLPDIDAVLRAPESLVIPVSPSARAALASGVAYHCGSETAPVVLQIAQRLYSEHLGEYAVLLVRDALASWPPLSGTPEWSRLAGSPLGQAILHA